MSSSSDLSLSSADLDERAQLRTAQALINDLIDRKPALYWLDFGLTVTLSWAMTIQFFWAPAWSVPQIAAMLIAAIGFFRTGTFIHEIAHFKHDEMTGFKRVWNLLLGIPLLMPWVLYHNHIEHHSQRRFGTPDDGEYLPLASTPPVETVKYLLQIPLLPLLAVIRFGVMGPLSHLNPALREWLLIRASAAITNPYYRKRFPARHEQELIRSEWFCFGWLLFLLGLTLFGPVDAIHWAMAYALLMLAVGLNWVRNLAAHGYANDGRTLSRLSQVEDSVNIIGQPWLTLWLFPVGLRYHALHHLQPGLPYHQLATAHHRLITRLPVGHRYHSCNHHNYFSVIGRLLRGAWHSRKRQDVIDRWQAGR